MYDNEKVGRENAEEVCIHFEKLQPDASVKAKQHIQAISNVHFHSE